MQATLHMQWLRSTKRKPAYPPNTVLSYESLICTKTLHKSFIYVVFLILYNSLFLSFGRSRGEGYQKFKRVFPETYSTLGSAFMLLGLCDHKHGDPRTKSWIFCLVCPWRMGPSSSARERPSWGSLQLTRHSGQEVRSPQASHFLFPHFLSQFLGN